MGHMYPVELSKLMVELSPTSLNECVLTAMEREIGVSCAEGVYTDSYMYRMAFESLLWFYIDQADAKFLSNAEEEKHAVKLWRKEELVDAEDGEHHLHVWYRILYRTLFEMSPDVEHIEHIEY